MYFNVWSVLKRIDALEKRVNEMKQEEKVFKVEHLHKKEKEDLSENPYAQEFNNQIENAEKRQNDGIIDEFDSQSFE